MIAQADYHNLKIAQVPVETSYTGKKRGSTFKNSVLYTLGVLKVIGFCLAAKAGMRTGLLYRDDCREKNSDEKDKIQMEKVTP